MLFTALRVHPAQTRLADLATKPSKDNVVYHIRVRRGNRKKPVPEGVW